jgi:hypothetical protein
LEARRKQKKNPREIHRIIRGTTTDGILSFRRVFRLSSGGFLVFLPFLDVVHNALGPRVLNLVNHLKPLACGGDDAAALEVDEVLGHRSLMKTQAFLHILDVASPNLEKTVNYLEANRVPKRFEDFGLSAELLLLDLLKEFIHILFGFFVNVCQGSHIVHLPSAPLPLSKPCRVESVSARFPGPHAGDIQVDMPNLGKTHLFRKIQPITIPIKMAISISPSHLFSPRRRGD